MIHVQPIPGDFLSQARWFYGQEYVKFQSSLDEKIFFFEKDSERFIRRWRLQKSKSEW
jgi:hypothetical protein